MEILLWKELLEPYFEAVDELVMKFEHINEEHHIRNTYSPIERVTGRVKTIRSILEKMQRKQIPFEKMEEEIEDIAGIRIICRFTEDIMKLAQDIRNRSDIEVIEEKDYLSRPKESGYRSYHMIAYYTVYTLEGPKKLQVEIQLRTMAMNFWATTEHSLQYKYKGIMPDQVASQLSLAAEAITKLDEIMSTVRSDIMDAQIHSRMETSLVIDILNAIENLYSITSERETKKIQDEFYRIYATHDLKELSRFHKELDILSEGYRVQSFDGYSDRK